MFSPLVLLLRLLFFSLVMQRLARFVSRTIGKCKCQSLYGIIPLTDAIPSAPRDFFINDHRFVPSRNSFELTVATYLAELLLGSRAFENYAKRRRLPTKKNHTFYPLGSFPSLVEPPISESTNIQTVRTRICSHRRRDPPLRFFFYVRWVK